MKFAICNETFAELNWPDERVFDYVAQCGYEGIEIAPFTIGDDVRTITSDKTVQLRRLAEDSGISIAGLHWILSNREELLLTSSENETRKSTAAYLKSLARWCRELGGDVMVFGSPKQRNRPREMSMQQGFQNAVATLQDVIPVLEETQVILAMEPLATWETNFLLTAEDALKLTRVLDSEYVRIMLDCKAMWAMETLSISEVIQRYRNDFVHFHANDPNLLGPGFGELEFEPIFAALDEINYDRWVSVEVFDYTPGPERIAKESIDYMRRCLPA